MASATTTVKITRSSTATPAPRIMPHSRWRGGSVMQAIAITTALSPDRMMLTPMILQHRDPKRRVRDILPEKIHR